MGFAHSASQLAYFYFMFMSQIKCLVLTEAFSDSQTSLYIFIGPHSLLGVLHVVILNYLFKVWLLYWALTSTSNVSLIHCCLPNISQRAQHQ